MHPDPLEQLRRLAARPDDDATRALIAALAERGAARTELALETLLERGPRIVPLLLEALDARGYEIRVVRQREAVCRLLGALGDAALVPRLLELHEDAALHALGELTERTGVEPLVAALTPDHDDGLQLRALEALEHCDALARPDVVAALVPWLEAMPLEDHTAQATVINALRRAGDAAALATGALLAAAARVSLPHASELLVTAAPHAPLAVVERVEALVQQSHPENCRLADVLRALPRDAGEARERASAAVRRLFDDWPWRDTIVALGELGTAQDLHALRALLLQRGHALMDALRPTVGALRQLRDPHLAELVTELLPRLGPMPAAELLRSLADDEALCATALETLFEHCPRDVQACVVTRVELAPGLAARFLEPLATALRRALDAPPTAHAALHAISRLPSAPDQLVEAVRTRWLDDEQRMRRAPKRQRPQARRDRAESTLTRLAHEGGRDRALCTALEDALALHRDALYARLGSHVHAALAAADRHHATSLDFVERAARRIDAQAHTFDPDGRERVGALLAEARGPIERLARLFPRHRPDPAHARCRDAILRASRALGRDILDTLPQRLVRDELAHAPQLLDAILRELTRRNAPQWLVDSVSAAYHPVPRPIDPG